MTGTPGEALRAAAQNNLLNIGTADHLVSKAVPDAILPGQLINWISRFDGEELTAKAEALEALLPKYADAADPYAPDILKEQWEGAGGNAFRLRWKELRNYIGTSEGEERRRILLGQIDAMKTLRNDIEDLQTACTNAIDDQLSSVRATYVKELCASCDGAAVNQALSDAGTGAGIGSAFGPAGTAAGSAIGGTIGLIRGFIEANEAKAAAIFGSGTSIFDDMGDIENSGNALALAGDSDDGNSLDTVKLGTKDPTGEEWDMDGEWEAA